MATNSQPVPGVDAFHKARSKFLDAIARCETIVCHLMRQNDLKVGAEPLCHKLEALAKLKASSRLAKAKQATILQSSVALTRVLPARADIVRSRLVIKQIGEETYACFANAAAVQDYGTIFRAFTIVELNDLVRTIEGIADQLEAIG